VGQFCVSKITVDIQMTLTTPADARDLFRDAGVSISPEIIAAMKKRLTAGTMGKFCRNWAELAAQVLEKGLGTRTHYDTIQSTTGKGLHRESSVS